MSSGQKSDLVLAHVGWGIIFLRVHIRNPFQPPEIHVALHTETYCTTIQHHSIHLCKKIASFLSTQSGSSSRLLSLETIETMRDPWLLVKTRPPQRSQLSSLPSLHSAPSLPWILPLPRRRYNDISSWHRPRHVAKAWNRVTTVTQFLWNSYQRTSGLYHQQMYLKQSQKTQQLVGLMCWFTSNSRLQFVLNYIFPKLSQTKFLRIVFCFDLYHLNGSVSLLHTLQLEPEYAFESTNG